MPDDFSKVANTPLIVTLAGKQISVRRLSIGQLFGKAESIVLSAHMDKVFQMASRLHGEEKTDYLAKATAALPTGEALRKLTSQFFYSLEGVRYALVEGMRQDQPNIENEIDVAELIQQDPEKTRIIVEYVLGIKSTASSKEDPRQTASPLENDENKKG